MVAQEDFYDSLIILNDLMSFIANIISYFLNNYSQKNITYGAYEQTYTSKGYDCFA
jgi:hypothetical protein